MRPSCGPLDPAIKIADYPFPSGLDPDQARWWYNLAMIYAYLGEPQTAMGCISRAIELEPANTDFLIYQQQLGAQLQRQAQPQ